MKVLVIGSNGREHALAAKYSQSKKTDVIFIAPGNGLTNYKTKKIKNIEIAMIDLDALVRFSKREKVDLVDVAQDDCLAKGYVDRFKRENIAVFGPTKKAAEIEWSKDWARKFMLKYHMPIPHFQTFSDMQNAISFIKKIDAYPVYVKASGLALGKGAIRAETKEQSIYAIDTMSQFGKAGETFLIEECLIGEEFSLFTICDGKSYQILSWAQDHKTVSENGQGPNTGGMGSVAPSGVLNKKILNDIEKKIIKPLMQGMQNERRPYSGILYLGGMVTKDGIKIIEFNARWGDPEAEVIIPSIKIDYLKIVNAVINKKLTNLTINFDKKVRLSIAGCSRGYPNDYSKTKRKEVFGLLEAMKLPGISIYGAGIKRKNNRFFANGGRVFHLVAEGKTIVQARARAYGAMSLIAIEDNNLHYRNDIGWKDMERIFT